MKKLIVTLSFFCAVGFSANAQTAAGSTVQPVKATTPAPAPAEVNDDGTVKETKTGEVKPLVETKPALLGAEAEKAAPQGRQPEARRKPR